MQPLIPPIKHGKVMNPDVGISTWSWTALLGITELGPQSIGPHAIPVCPCVSAETGNVSEEQISIVSLDQRETRSLRR